LLGAVNAFLGTTFGLYIGRVGLLVTTIIIIRVLPGGISGLIDRWRMRPTASRPSR
jgi:branched-chain amino acid transport system permease protein